MGNENFRNNKKEEAKVMITIGLLTNSVISANYGVNALSISNILLIERSCKKNNIDHQYVIFGDVLREEEQISKIKSISELHCIKVSIVPELEFRKIKSVSNFIKNIKVCDVVFDTSGGDSYSDIYGNNRMLHQYLPKWISLLLGKKLVLTPQTLGPFKSGIWEKLCRSQMKKCMAVFARDNTSFVLGKKDFGLENIYQVTDMAMVLPYERLRLNKNVKKERIRVGVNVSGLLYNGGYTENNQFGLKSNYKELVDKIIFMLTKEFDCEVYLVPHVITTGTESDNEACEEIKKKYPVVQYEGVFQGPIEAKSFISGLDMLIGSRMHSTIAAISSGVPVVPLSYSRKFEGLFGSIAYKECINLKEDDENAVLEKIQKYINEIGKMNDSVKKSNEIIKEKISLYSSALDDVLEKCNNENK